MTNGKRLTKAEYTTLANFRYELRTFLQFSETEAKKAGLSPQQHQALLAIQGHAFGGIISVGELAERLGIHQHSAVGLINRLVENSLVLRVREKGDQRRVLLKLTRRGISRLEKLTSAHQEELQRIVPNFEQIFKQLKRSQSG